MYSFLQYRFKMFFDEIISNNNRHVSVMKILI